MMTRKPGVGAIAFVVLCVRAASAQAPDQPDDQVNCPAPDTGGVACPEPQAQAPQPPPPEPQLPARLPPPEASPGPTPEIYVPPPEWYDDLGYAVSVGGGVSDFAHSTMRHTTGTAGSWDARVTVGTRSYLAVEALYIGSAQSIDRVGLSHGATLYGNGVQADLRINTIARYPLQPFFYGGAAYRYYSLSTSANLSDVAQSTNVFELPVGIGLAAYFRGVAIDVRGEYRFAWGGDDLLPELDNTSAQLDRWDVSGNVGYEF